MFVDQFVKIVLIYNILPIKFPRIIHAYLKFMWFTIAGGKEKPSAQRALGRNERGASEGAFGILIERIEARGETGRDAAWRGERIAAPCEYIAIHASPRPRVNWFCTLYAGRSAKDSFRHADMILRGKYERKLQ